MTVNHTEQFVDFLTTARKTSSKVVWSANGLEFSVITSAGKEMTVYARPKTEELLAKVFGEVFYALYLNPFNSDDSRVWDSLNNFTIPESVIVYTKER